MAGRGADFIGTIDVRDGGKRAFGGKKMRDQRFEVGG